jgi:hypothetical protein
MSRELSSVAVTLFDTEVKHAYQATTASLAGTTTERKGVTAAEYKFRKMGKGIATQATAPSSDAIPMNIEHSLVTCTLTDWQATDYTYIFNAAEVNFDEVKELSMTIAGALGRCDDQLKINAMAAGSYNATAVQGSVGGLVTTAIGGADTNLNVAKLRRIKKYMDDNEVPMEGRHITASPSGLEGLLGETQVTSADYNSVKALVQGDVDTFLGFKFHIIGIRKEGGLPKSGAVRDGFAWHESAIGYANGIDMTTKIDWSTDKDSWKSCGYLKAGAVIRDIDGIVKYQATEA